MALANAIAIMAGLSCCCVARSPRPPQSMPMAPFDVDNEDEEADETDNGEMELDLLPPLLLLLLLMLLL